MFFPSSLSRNPRMSTFRAYGMCLILIGVTVGPMPLLLFQARTHHPVRPPMSLWVVPQWWWAQAAVALEWTLLATHQSLEMTLKRQLFHLMMWLSWMMIRWMVMNMMIWVVTCWMMLRTCQPLIRMDPHIQPLGPHTMPLKPQQWSSLPTASRRGRNWRLRLLSSGRAMGLGPQWSPKTNLTKIQWVASQCPWCFERNSTNFQVQKSKFHFLGGSGPLPTQENNPVF